MKSKPLGLAFSFLVAASIVHADRPIPRPVTTSSKAAAVSPEKKIKVIKQLAGTSWRVVEVDGKEVAPAPEGWQPLSLEFGRDGVRANGNAGVNHFGGRYDQHDAELSFGPLAMTRRMGPEELMAAEMAYTQALSKVTGWRQEEERLVLLGPDEKRLVVLERVVADDRRK